MKNRTVSGPVDKSCLLCHLDSSKNIFLVRSDNRKLKWLRSLWRIVGWNGKKWRIGWSVIHASWNAFYLGKIGRWSLLSWEDWKMKNGGEWRLLWRVLGYVWQEMKNKTSLAPCTNYAFLAILIIHDSSRNAFLAKLYNRISQWIKASLKITDTKIPGVDHLVYFTRYMWISHISDGVSVVSDGCYIWQQVWKGSINAYVTVCCWWTTLSRSFLCSGKGRQEASGVFAQFQQECTPAHSWSVFQLFIQLLPWKGKSLDVWFKIKHMGMGNSYLGRLLLSKSNHYF